MAKNGVKELSNMTAAQIEEKIRQITAEILKIEQAKITLQSSFAADLDADSLDQVELMMAIEAAFGCEIPDEEASKIATISDAVNYVKNTLGVE